MPTKQYYISSQTHALIEITAQNWMGYFSRDLGLDKKLIYAICKKESGLNPFAIRFEPHLKHAAWYKDTLSKDELEDDFSYCSYGYMQVLFGIAKTHGFKGTPFDLFNIKNALAYGCIHLSKLMKKYGNLDAAISSYNQGSPRKGPDGRYKNQAYVDGVKDAMG